MTFNAYQIRLRGIQVVLWSYIFWKNNVCNFNCMQYFLCIYISTFALGGYKDLYLHKILISSYFEVVERLKNNQNGYVNRI